MLNPPPKDFATALSGGQCFIPSVRAEDAHSGGTDLLLCRDLGVVVSAALAAAALFGVGAGISLLTGRGVLYCGLRQILFGLLAAGITFGLGRVIGSP